MLVVEQKVGCQRCRKEARKGEKVWYVVDILSTSERSRDASSGLENDTGVSYIMMRIDMFP